MGGTNERGRWKRRARLDTPQHRSIHLMIAVVLTLAGLTAALLSVATPTTRMTTLATSGSFFALAESGNTLYAASENGGSVLLERSTDRGVDWTASPVPYSIVASGSPWTHAAIAVDGSHVVLAATSGGDTSEGYYYSSPAVYSCAQNSTLLLAASSNGGLTWSTSTSVTANMSVTSLQAGIVGDSAAVAWLGETTTCYNQVGRVEAVTSGDAGQTWSPVQLVQAKGESIPSQEGVEIAQGNQGLVLAFGLASNSNDTSQLGLWTYSSQSLAGFVPTTILPAPTSWTLQGSSDSLAYLLTPSYLIPLTSPPYTALPFNQLQADGTSVGMLPHVVSLVPLGSGRVEVAATTPDSLGVDCWVFDTTVASVTQTCHVSLDATLLPESQTLPIVSLIDGGGWWTAIGASGNQCGYDCPEPTYPGGWNFTAAPVAGSAAVGTSVCITGCSSAEGLAAYSFSQATSASQGAVGAAAGALLGLGLLWLAIWALATPRARARDDGPSPSGVSPTASGGTERADRRQIRRAYLGGLGVWVLVWTPFVLIALFASSTADSTTLAGVILLSAVVGAAVTIPFHGSARSRLQTMHGVTTGELLGGAHPPFPKPAFERVQRAAYYAYGSWAAGAALLIVLMIDVASGLPTTAGSTPGSGTGGIAPAPGWIVLGAIAVLFAGLRALYHYNLIRAATTPVAEESGEVELDAVDGPSIRRTQVGAALVPLSPFVGFLLGLVLQTVVPASPYLLAGLFVPLNFLGIAVLLGCFGPTVWSSAGADGPPADPPALGSTGPGIAHV